MLFVRRWSFYKEHEPDPLDPDGPDANLSYENAILFLVANFQYISTCVSFSVSKPFRRPLYTNWIFTLSLIVIISFSFFLILSDAEWSANFFLIQSENVTLYYRLCLVLIVVVNFLLTLVCEKVFIWYLSIYWKRRLDRKA